MDPNLYHLDWARVAEVLVAVTILAFIVERALALLFESRFFLEVVEGKKPESVKKAEAEKAAAAAKEKLERERAGEGEAGKGKSETAKAPETPKGVGRFPMKEAIAFVVAAAVCVIWKFDAISMIFPKEQTTVLGAVVTGALVAGGSKASIRLFRDAMGVKSTARRLLDEEAEAKKG
ncbi:hypothetical protein KAW64_11570 [bacterium]|nr:hypothetical protein [bacterium]